MESKRLDLRRLLYLFISTSQLQSTCYRYIVFKSRSSLALAYCCLFLSYHYLPTLPMIDPLPPIPLLFLLLRRETASSATRTESAFLWLSSRMGFCKVMASFCLALSLPVTYNHFDSLLLSSNTYLPTYLLLHFTVDGLLLSRICHPSVPLPSMDFCCRGSATLPRSRRL